MLRRKPPPFLKVRVSEKFTLLCRQASLVCETSREIKAFHTRRDLCIENAKNRFTASRMQGRKLLTKRRSKTACLALAMAATALFVVPSVQASPVNYTFTVNVTSGPLSGTSSTGSFSYDTSSIVDDRYVNKTGLLTALAFTFNGTAFNAGSANTGDLVFDSAGNLTSFLIGNNCTPGSCTVDGITNQWWIDPPSNTVSSSLFYSNQGFDGFGVGDVTFSLAGVPPSSSVPEPGALGMFGFGALLLGVFVSRRRRSC